MPIPRRPLPHENGPCPFPIVTPEEAFGYQHLIPTTPEGWAALEKIEKIDANDLVHELGPAGFRKWLDESPTMCLHWSNSEIVSGRTLRRHYKKMREPVIHGLLRRSETMNIIAPPKAGKSWMGLNIAMNVIGGGNLFDQFRCERGRVLIVDNELHCETIAQRLKTVADKLNVPIDRAESLIDFLPLRGRLTDIPSLGDKLCHIKRKAYSIVILDAFYKFYPEDFDENSNSNMARLYTTLDELAEHLNSALILIHHSSKGGGVGKSVTDMGAGAGAQSRACDAHLVIREHEEPGIFVLESANRSFEPIKPFCAKFNFPKWEYKPNYDPAMLKGLAKKKDGYGSQKVGGYKKQEQPNQTKGQPAEHVPEIKQLSAPSEPFTDFVIPEPGKGQRAIQRTNIEKFFTTEIMFPMTLGEIIVEGQGKGMGAWNRFGIAKLIKEFLEKGVIAVVEEGGGRNPATYISVKRRTSLPADMSDQAEEFHDGYTAGFNQESAAEDSIDHEQFNENED